MTTAMSTTSVTNTTTAAPATTANVTFGGDPSKGTKRDKRLRENAAEQGLTDEAMVDVNALPEDQRGKPFTILLCVEGYETADHRLLELGSTTWREGPMPLMMRDTDTHGSGEPAPTYPIGQVDTVYRDPEDESRIMGRGHLMPGEVGDRAEQIVRHAYRTVSIDGFDESVLGPERQPTDVDQDGYPLQTLTRFADTYIDAVTVVRSPAFRCCSLWFDDEQQPDWTAEAHGGFIDPDRAPEVHEVEPDPNDLLRLLLASGGGPLNPPKEWFLTPEPDRRQEITVTADGHLTGHLAGWRECHTALPGCVVTEKSKTVPPFLGFHRTEAHCADGTKIACGWLPIDTNHSKLGADGRREAEGWSQDATWEHYENSGYLLAKVRASNGKHGVWLSGCLLPGLNERALSIAQGLSVSGHWNVFTDPRTKAQYRDELLGVLGGVSQPGYPETRTRPELLVASAVGGGQEVVGHVGAPPCNDFDTGEETIVEASDLVRLARLESVIEVLVAHAPDDVIAALADIGEMPTSTPADGEPVEHAIHETVEVNVGPLTPQERARWSAKYDDDARAAAVTAGHARPDGSCVIEDGDDLFLAARDALAREDAGLMAHVARAAIRQGYETDDLRAFVAECATAAAVS